VSEREVEVPAGPLKELRNAAPVPAFTFGDDNSGRDTSKPIGFDEHGRPLYAPRGFIARWPS
jgi:hypothetical protein